MTSVQRLVEKLQQRGIPISDGWEFHRTYAGSAQRVSEAWSWWIDWVDQKNHRWEIGSCWPVGELLRAGDIAVEKQSWRTPCSYVVEVTG